MYFDIPHAADSSKESRTVNRILATLGKRLSKKHNMQVSGDTAMMPEGVIKLVGLRFHLFRIITKEEARAILVDCMEQFLHEINTDQEIRPYLKTYPFTPMNIDIAIFIYDNKRNDIHDPHLGLITARMGKLNYVTYKKGSQLCEHQSDTQESFEDAVKLTHPHM